MIQHLAALSYSYTTQPTATSHVSGALILPLVLVGLVVLVVLIAAMWKLFVKAGRPGWAAIVPIYNTWVLAEIVGKPGWWGLYPLLGAIPFLGAVVSFIISIMFAVWLARSFGKGVGFAILGLILFPFVGYPILGFGSAQYLGPDGQAAPASGTGPNSSTPFNPVQPEAPTSSPTVEAPQPSPTPADPAPQAPSDDQTPPPAA